jgi:AGCS family alanine or glycine:cation symporter
MESLKALEAYLLPIFDVIGGYVWGWPMLVLLIGTGVWMTLLLKGLQFKMLPHALKLAFSPQAKNHDSEHDGDISHFQALMTALCATVGTGNIAGVATAIAAGGPGAIFWMWITGLLGMATKYAEAVLGVHYRQKNSLGEMCGGPMYYISNGLNMKWLATIFAILLAISALGIGNMVQSNSMADVMESTFKVDPVVTGLVFALLCSLVIIGGIKRIGLVASAVVPFMIFLYVGTGTIILLLNIDAIPQLLHTIFHDAFTGTAAAGGFLGAAIKEVMRYGFSRGVFSNESGMGTSPIAAAAAKTRHPVDQALVSMTQTFIDTIVVCSFTGLVILISGHWLNGVDGASLTASSFTHGLGGVTLFGFDIGGVIVSICLVFFTFTTIIGWAYYGEKGVSFIWGSKSVALYKVIFVLFVFIGAIMQLKFVWTVAEVFTGLMIIPNLIALILLSGKIKHLTIDYFRNEKDGMGYQVEPFHNKD